MSAKTNFQRKQYSPVIDGLLSVTNTLLKRVQALESDMREDKELQHVLEDCVHKNSMNLSRLTLLVSEMNRQLCQKTSTVKSSSDVEIRGNCRVIHFQSVKAQ